MIEKDILAATVADSSAEVRFILFEEDPVAAAALPAAMAPVLDALSARVSPFAPGLATELELVVPGRRFRSVADAFQTAHALEATYGIDRVEPDLEAEVMPDAPEILPAASLEGTESATCWAPEDDRLTDRFDWALRALRVPEAWAWCEAHGLPARGEGIVIAQPDTGITGHAELGDVTYAGQINLLENTPGAAVDILDKGNPGHGTGTASVVVSGPAGQVIGTAPGALLLPIRAIRSVIRVSQANVARAVDRATEAGAAVITMSLGGVFSVALERAIRRAIARDVIVLAAAGNCVHLVVWPARYDMVLGVGGVNVDDAMWRGSSRGRDVAIAAPAENVYRANGRSGDIGQGQGTSFAVALTAGVAACWLAAHGRDRIAREARVRGETVTGMFMRMVQETARTPAGWEVGRLGAGIVDAEALLKSGFGPVSGQPESAPAPPERNVATLLEEVLGGGTESTIAGVGLERHAMELSYLLLARGGSTESGTGREVSAQFAQDMPAALLNALGVHPAPGAAPPDMAAPAIRRPAEDASPPAGKDRVDALRHVIASSAAARSRGRAADPSSAFESSSATAAGLPGPDTLLQQVEAVAGRMPADEVVDPKAFRMALEAVYRYADPGIRKLAPGGSPPTVNELRAVEAVVRADGTRPSLLIAEGTINLDHPMLGKDWSDEAAKHAPAIARMAAAVGRVQPRGGHASRFVGTGVLVDADAGLVLTNFHVVAEARKGFGVPMSASADGRRLTVAPGTLDIDFVGERASLATNRWEVFEVLLPDGAGAGFGGLDAAVLRIRPIAGQRPLPTPVPLLSADPKYAQGGMPSLSTIGFPGPPPATVGRYGEVDWAWVTKTLFGDLFGFKRFAPGEFTEALGTHQDDALGIAFGHDATTLGGASGSLVHAWADPQAPAFGLHFFGHTGKANHAIALAAVKKQLEGLGLRFEP